MPSKMCGKYQTWLRCLFFFEMEVRNSFFIQSSSLKKVKIKHILPTLLYFIMNTSDLLVLCGVVLRCSDVVQFDTIVWSGAVQWNCVLVPFASV